MAGAPKLGRTIFNQPRSPHLSSAAEELLQAPENQLLGTVSHEALKQVIDKEPPPPWETDKSYAKHDNDGRKFVQVPDNWVLRWLAPRLVDTMGFRDWQAVAGNDPRVTVKNKAMIAPDNTIRRGGHGGDFLAWMYRSWYESRQQIKAEHVRKVSSSAKDRAEQTRESINRGDFGKYVHVDSVKTPTHTHGEGSTMKD